MFRFKKTVAAALCAAVGFGCIVGCDNKKANGDVSVVTIWSNNSHSKSVYEKLISEYNETTGKEKGIKIDYIVKEGETMSQNIDIAIQNGQLPEMFSWGGVRTLCEKDAIMPIEELNGMNEVIADYKDLAVDNVHSFKGKLYSVPTGATTQALVYNKEMFREAGLVDENGEPKPPETFDEVREYAKKLTNPSKKQFGIIIPIKWSTMFNEDIVYSMLPSCGNIGYDPVTGVYDYSSLVPILNCYMGMKNDGSVFPGADGIDNDQARAYFANGNVGMKFAWSYDVGVYNDQFAAKCEWGVAPVPVIDKNAKKYKQRMAMGHSFWVSKTATEKVPAEKLVEVYKFFLSDKFITECYKQGVSAPVKFEKVKDIKLDNPKKGWVEFCKLAEVSIASCPEPQKDITGQKTMKESFLNDVWSGNKTPEQFCSEYTKIMNDGVKKYYEIHTDEDVNEYIRRNWNSER